METIAKVWFDQDRIWILTDQGVTLSRPLEAFPLLKEASDEQRVRFTIGIDGDDLRWDELDEDISTSVAFTKRPSRSLTTSSEMCSAASPS